jgi:hypothetical protein
VGCNVCFRVYVYIYSWPQTTEPIFPPLPAATQKTYGTQDHGRCCCCCCLGGWWWLMWWCLWSGLACEGLCVVLAKRQGRRAHLVVADVRRSVCAVCVCVKDKAGPPKKSTHIKREGQGKEGKLVVVLVVCVVVAIYKKRTWQINNERGATTAHTQNQSHRK